MTVNDNRAAARQEIYPSLYERDWRADKIVRSFVAELAGAVDEAGAAATKP